MTTPPVRPRPEPTTGAGEALLSHNHLAILHGLYDRPDGMAASTTDLLRAALPYIRLFRTQPSFSTLWLAANRMYPGWAEHQKLGARVVWRITARGRAIVERQASARIRGHGRYVGLAPFRRKALEQRRIAAATLPAESREQVARELVRRWAAVNPAFSFSSGLMQQFHCEKLFRFLMDYMATFGVLPEGEHVIVPEGAGPPLTVDFDLLGGEA